VKRGLACLSAAFICALLGASSVESASSRAPRFLATISGTQHFEWMLRDTRSGGCAYEGHGEQSERFRTARAVKVIAPPPRGGSSREFQALARGRWGRVVPLIGTETRTYALLKAPTAPCPAIRPEFRHDCRGTNPLLPRAGVVLMRDREKLAVHVPVDTPWIDRQPSACDIRLFDLRNFFLSAVFGVRTYAPIRGGTFEKARTLRASIGVRYCVDPTESSDFEVVLKTTCEQPLPSPRGPVLTGQLTAQWTITLRRSH
jgi:hypothetical protein